MARRSYRDPKVLKRYTLWKASELHPEEFEVDRIAATKHQDVHDLVWYELNLADLISRMEEDYSPTMNHSGCAIFCNKLLKKIPKELYLNIEEYLDNKTMTPIMFNGMCIDKIMKEYNVDFYLAIQTLSNWNNLGRPDNNYFDRWLNPGVHA